MTTPTNDPSTVKDCSTPRPTPETDAIAEPIANAHNEWACTVNATAYSVVPSDFARALERQRDEARDALRDCLSAIDDERERYARWRLAAGMTAQAALEKKGGGA